MICKPGDVFVVRSGDLFSRAICAVERRDPGGDSTWSHAGVIVGPNGKTIESLWTVRYGNINDYAGCPLLVGRYKHMDDERFKTGMAQILPHLGETYPAYRIPLMLLGLGRFVHWYKLVCSELAVSFLDGACFRDRFSEFEDPFGWTPADVAKVLERWEGFEVVYKKLRSE
ncbi:MAG: hypothetical protein ABSH41_26180 [Syntrophobacteraceae bacterium]|jgi:hypothetical protein